MSKQNTTTRTEDKASSAGQGAPATKPSAQQVKSDNQEHNPVIDPEMTSNNEDPSDTVIEEHISDNDGDSTGEPLASKPVFIPVIAVAYEGTAELVRRLWEKFLPEGVPLNIGIGASLEEMLSYIISSPAIPGEFIFVPANCVPVAPVDMADLSQIKVYVHKDGTRSFGERLPMLLNKDRLVESLAAESGPAADDFFEKYVKAHHPGTRPMEVSHDFGNFVTLVMRSNPCENVVIGGMCQRKFIAASAEGWKAIEHLLNKRLE